jgi:hypothetical protein
VILQLNPTIPLDTDKGPADAKFLFDYSEEHKVMFGVFVRATGEFWVIPQDKVRLEKNITGGVRCCETVAEKKDREGYPTKEQVMLADTYHLAEAFASRLDTTPGGAFPDKVLGPLIRYLQRTPVPLHVRQDRP